MNVNDVDRVRFLFGRPLEGTPCEHPAGTAWQVVGWHDVSDPRSLGDGDGIISFLLEVSAGWEAQQQQAEKERLARQQEVELSRALRLQQDADFEESLRIDQERERSKLKTEEEAALALSPAPSPAPAAAVPAPVAEDKEPPPLQLRRRENAKRLLEQGPLDFAGEKQQKCTLVLRMPNGHRIERVFSANATVGAVYDWVDCVAELAALQAEENALGTGLLSSQGAAGGKGVSGADFEVPEEFLLCVTFPRSPLMDRNADLRTAGLCPNAILQLESQDDE